MQSLTPLEIVKELNKYIVGQKEAKKAVAIALRNRYRRRRLPPELQEEIYPKNIIMIGPTGVGKTEIARRLAKLVRAPFIKVEATKFTEVGYVGRDVDSMVRDLLELSVNMVKQEKMEEVQPKGRDIAEERIVDYFIPTNYKKSKNRNPFELLLGQNIDSSASDEQEDINAVERRRRREIIKQKVSRHELDDEIIEIEVEEKNTAFLESLAGTGVDEVGINLQDLFGNFMPKNKKKRRMNVEEARKVLTYEESQRLIDMDEVKREAIKRVEEDGIIFLDEIDKIASRDNSYGPDVSRGGVQRDILPIVEGSTVLTKYGPVKTDHVLFIAAGAFHMAKPSDLIPELQGRFPIRVELESLTVSDLKRVLTEPHNSLIRQYKALLSTEELKIEFDEKAIEYIAQIAYDVNNQTENIGARRLYTIMEKVLEDLLFEAPNMQGQDLTIDVRYVENKLKKIIKDDDLSRYIL